MDLRYTTAVALVACCVGGGASTAAQSGALTGVVVDATGAVLPGATVTLRGGPGGLQQVQTDAEGRFAVTALAPGAYTVTVFLSGFGEVTLDRVTVGADAVALPPITLRLAAFADAAVVTATRIEEPLQSVPMSISAVTGADIERRAICRSRAASTRTRRSSGRTRRPTTRWACAARGATSATSSAPPGSTSTGPTSRWRGSRRSARSRSR